MHNKAWSCAEIYPTHFANTKGKISGGLSKLQAIVMWQTKSLLLKVLVKNSYGKLFNKNDPIKMGFVSTIEITYKRR